jgi:C_GCAxxG_C_C family probable redox protein
LQDAIHKKEDDMLKAATGLEGGAVACGSTCGVVTGGALGLALMHETSLREGRISAEPALLARIGEYVDWFGNKFGTTICRERSGVDFYKATGQLRYFVPGDRVARCLSHAWKAVNFLTSYGKEELRQGEDADQADDPKEPGHCARSVLRQVQNRTGVGDTLLERSAIAFDGGVGLSGGLCGALAGALMAINLVLGMNTRQMSRSQIIKAFVIGHVNLLIDTPKGMPEPFGIGKGMVQAFRNQAGSIECREITNKAFGNWGEFQEYLLTAKKCKELIALSADLASEALDRGHSSK